MKTSIKAKYLALGMMCVAAPAVAIAAPIETSELDEQNSVTLIGKVLNENNEPLAGVVVKVVDSTIQGVTNIDGEFNINVPQGFNQLSLRYIGYTTVTVEATPGTENVYTLAPDAYDMSKVLTLAQGLTTTEEALTGAVSSVSGTTLEKMPSAGTTARLGGQLSGLGFISGTSDLNADGATLFIRGRRSINGNDPLIVLNGVPSPTTDLNIIDPSIIEDIVLLKDASSTALYGQQGANGALLINTRQGRQGRTNITLSAQFAVQQATVLPTVMNSWQYMRLRDQALMNDGLAPLYSQDQIDLSRQGNNDLYPNNRWYDMYTKDAATMQRYNVNITGGNQRVLYFLNASYMRQGSLLKTEKQEKYNPDFYLNRFNVTSNLQVNIFSNLKAGLNTNVVIDNQNSPNSDDFIGTMLRTPAIEYGPFTTDIINEEGEIVPYDKGIVAQDFNMNPIYGRLNKSGNRNTTRTTVNAALNLDWGLDFITKGLYAKGLLGYEARYSETTYGNTDYQRYILDEDATAAYGKPVFTEFGTNVNTPLSMSKGSEQYYYLNFLGGVGYNREFDNTHSVDALASYFYQDYMKQNFDAQGMLPYSRSNVSLHAKYGFKHRYYLQFDGSYSASDAFCKAPNKVRWGFFPSVSGSWVISNESFYGRTGMAQWLNMFKLRASYGLVGNDIIAGGRRFLYMDQYSVGAGGYLSQSPYYGAMAAEGLLGNPAIEWEKVYKQNYGIDLGFGNCVAVHFDYFRENMHDMVVQSELFPDFSGTDRNNLPYINYGKMRNYGFDFDVNFHKQLNKDWFLSVGARGGYAKNTVISTGELDRAEAGYFYGLRTEGYSLGTPWGYVIDYSNGNGFYNSLEEIVAGPLFEGEQPRVGDFRYLDLNEDGIINEKDMAPFDGTDIPTFNYGFDVQARWRDFDLYMLFQGATGRSVFTSGLGAWENEWRGSYADIHLHAYTPERFADGAEITYPALTSTNSTSLRANSFFITNRDYLRLKTLEFGYNLPSKICRKATLQAVRFYFTGMNLLTFDKRRFKDFDVEAINAASYPIYRTYNIGVNITF